MKVVRVRNLLETAAIWLMKLLFGNMPRRLNLAVGRCLGWLFYLLAVKRRKIALDNLKKAFQDEKDLHDRRMIARRSFQSLTMNVTEFFLFPSLTRDSVSTYVTIEGEEHLREALQQEKGVLTLSGHIGNWDILSAVIALRGYDVALVSKLARSEAVNRFWMQYRRDVGIKIFSGRGTMKESLRHLVHNGILGMVTDQNARRSEGIFVPFFGREACTLPSLALLARRTGSPVLPVYSYREGARHHVVIEKPLSQDSLSDRDMDLLEKTRSYTEWTERIIRLHPEQWIWLHDRWKTRPEGGTTERPGD